MHTNKRTTVLEEYPRYVIGLDGSVYSDYRKRLLKPSLNNKGYLQVRLINRKGKTVTLGIHRLLCLCFKKHEGDSSNLVVNHLDGDKLNNDLDNLEWTTYLGNLQHAAKLGLTEKCKPVAVIQLGTWTVIEYDSVVACSRFLGISKDKVSLRINNFPLKYPNEDFIIVYQNKVETLLKKLAKKEYKLNSGGLNQPVHLKVLSTGEILRFDKISSLASYLKVPMPTISTWLKIEGQPVLPGYIQIKKESDSSPWRVVTDRYLELGKTCNKRPVMVKTEKEEPKVFISGVECAKVMGITPTALLYRLKSNGQKVFQDGYLYAYYDVAMQNGLIK